jgi:hypothetical protein
MELNPITARYKDKYDADIYVFAHASAPFVRPEIIKQETDAVLGEKFDSTFFAERIKYFLWQDAVAINFDPINIPTKSKSACHWSSI